MQVQYRIHPSIGIARLGNSPDKFYLAPREISQRPIECDKWGDEFVTDDDQGRFVKKYKDDEGRVKRQAAKFWIYRYDQRHPQGIKVDITKEFKEFAWTVHLANKKAAWYEFKEFEGDLMKGPDNSYKNRKVPFRNPEIKGLERQKMIIDAGPRTLTKPSSVARFTKDEAPPTYEYVSFPKKPKIGFQIKTLGEIKTDSNGNLLVLGGYGNSGGDVPIYSYGGEDTWNDDVSDGPVRCHVKTKDGQEYDLDAWIVVGSPNFCPEIVNITTLDDVMFDVAVRKLGSLREFYDYSKYKKYESEFNKHYNQKYGEYYKKYYKQKFKKYFNKFSKKLTRKKAARFANDAAKDEIEKEAKRYATKKAEKASKSKWGWNPNYKANFKRDVEPIIRRPAGYRWVANVPSMIDFISPPFNVRDASKKNEVNRWRYFNYWRKPGYIEPGLSYRDEKESNAVHYYGQRTQAFSEDEIGKGIPLMPVNSGSNVLTDAFVDKFATLSSTQYRLLKQWAYGKFSLEEDDIITFKDSQGFSLVHPLDRASVGNCVGIPMCPGIEVTWSIRNPHIYLGPYRIKHSKIENEYGLNPYHDETERNSKGQWEGCEPGDLTKRMANPWQSDLFQCNVDYVTFRDDSDKYNRDGKESPDPPTYVAYWWPPSAPWDVIAGIETAEEQMDAGWISAGRQVRYTRGIRNIVEMIYGWKYLGFILNQNDRPDRNDFQYFVEKERNHKEFVIENVEWELRRIKIRDKEKTMWTPKFDESYYEPVFSLKRMPKIK